MVAEKTKKKEEYYISKDGLEFKKIACKNGKIILTEGKKYYEENNKTICFDGLEAYKLKNSLNEYLSDPLMNILAFPFDELDPDDYYQRVNESVEKSEDSVLLNRLDLDKRQLLDLMYWLLNRAYGIKMLLDKKSITHVSKYLKTTSENFLKWLDNDTDPKIKKTGFSRASSGFDEYPYNFLQLVFKDEDYIELPYDIEESFEVVLDTLSEMERDAVHLIYRNVATMERAANMLEISRQRVSQICFEVQGKLRVGERSKYLTYGRWYMETKKTAHIEDIKKRQELLKHEIDSDVKNEIDYALQELLKSYNAKNDNLNLADTDNNELDLSMRLQTLVSNNNINGIEELYRAYRNGELLNIYGITIEDYYSIENELKEYKGSRFYLASRDEIQITNMIERTRSTYEKGMQPIREVTSSRYIVKISEENDIKSLQEGYVKYQSGELREIIDPYSNSYQELEKIFKIWLGRNFKPLRLKVGRKKNSE